MRLQSQEKGQPTRREKVIAKLKTVKKQKQRFADWDEFTTLKVNSFHTKSPISRFSVKHGTPSSFKLHDGTVEAENDKMYFLTSSSKDGVIKLTNVFESDLTMQFCVPKEECTSMVMHPFKPYLVAAFTEGYIRFFDIGEKSTSLGRAKISENDYINQLVLMPTGNHLLCTSALGIVVLIFVERWDPLAIRIDSLASVNAPVHSFEVSFIEPYNKFLVGTKNGKVLVYNKRNFNAFSQEPFRDETPQFSFMDSLNLVDFIANGFSEIDSKTLTLDHYYQVQKKHIV